jgi:hypothetical protein
VDSFDTSAIAVTGGHVYVADDLDGLVVIAVGDGASVPAIGHIAGFGYVKDVAVVGSQAYAAAGDSGLVVIDLADPAAPAIIGRANTPGIATGVVVAGGLAYVADFESGMQVVDISTPTAPAVVGGIDTAGEARGIALAGSLVLLAEEEIGLSVIDVSNPSAPVARGNVGTSRAMDVVVDGSLAYVADGNAGLRIVEFADPAHPVIIGTVDPGEFVAGVAVAGNHAYLGAGDSGFHVADVTDPQTPVIVAGVDTPGDAEGVVITGVHAYVADYLAGCMVIDISVPAAPRLLGGGDTPGSAWVAAVEGDLVAVASGNELTLLPAQCPVTEPVEIASFTATVEDAAVILHWEVALATDLVGFSVLRSENGERGEYGRIHELPVTGSEGYRYRDANVRPGSIYHYAIEALSRDGSREHFGPVSAQAMQPAAEGVGITPRLDRVRPNPSPVSGGVAIQFALPRRMQAQLTIYDSAGRLVRLLADEVLPAGSHVRLWDGRDTRGRAAAAGVYRCRLTTGRTSLTVAIVRLP